MEVLLPSKLGIIFKRLNAIRQRATPDERFVSFIWIFILINAIGVC